MENQSSDDPRDNISPKPAEADSDGDWLDTEHHARFTRVRGCDSKRTRDRSADAEIARSVEEDAILGGDRRALGDDEHVDAIMNSGWFPHAQSIFVSARMAWILDAVLWTALWLSVWMAVVRAFSHA